MEHNLPLDSGIGQCCTCGKVIQIRYADAGHFIGRGLGGKSGVYFDARNINLQCKGCNAFKQGAPHEYRKFMLEKYGQEVIDELERKDKIPPDFSHLALAATEQFYKEKYEELKKEIR